MLTSFDNDIPSKSCWFTCQVQVGSMSRESVVMGLHSTTKMWTSIFFSEFHGFTPKTRMYLLDKIDAFFGHISNIVIWATISILA